MSINSFVGVGRLTRDPDLRYSQSGVAVCNFTIACNRHFKSSDGQDADFINCVTFRKAAENLAQYMKKGSQIGVDGRIQTRTYEGKDGKTVFVTEVVADSVQFLETRNSSQQSGNTRKSQVDTYNKELEKHAEPIDINDDDLPF